MHATVNPASRLIDERIRELGAWRGETLARMRALVLDTVPAIVEEWKWNNPVWSRDGIICTGEAYAKVVKLTFAVARAFPTHRTSSTPASKATRAGRSTSARERR